MNRIDSTSTWDSPRIIIHADMDAFFAAVEQLDNPEYRGKPLVIGTRSKRGVVSTASYEARPYGLRSAMSMVKALQLCPHVIVAPPNMKRYQEVSGIIMRVFLDYSPQIEPLSLDEAFIDMSGAEKIFGPPRKMAELIQRDVFDATGGLTVSVGVAANKYVAKVASDFQKPNGLTVVPPGTEKEFLWPMSISDIWGVGPKSREQVERYGYRTIGDIAQSPMEVMEQRFGSQGIRIWELANGIDTRAVEAREEAKSVGREYTMDKDVVGIEALWPYLRRSADSVARTLRSDKIRARGVRVKLKTAKFKTKTRQCTLEQPTDSAREMLDTATELLKKFDLTEPMRLVGLTTFNFVPWEEQLDMFESTEKKKDRAINKTIDEVFAKFGDNAIGRAADLQVGSNDGT